MAQPESDNSRRAFLKSSGSVFGASWVALNLPLILSASVAAAQSKEAGAGFKNISFEESVELSALVDQIVPADETPGASEIGVVYFIDVALGGFMSSSAAILRQGLDDLQQKTRSEHPGFKHFSELSFEQQTAVLKSIEDTPFFEMLYFMTMSGMFSLPGYAGNRNNAGWELVGFDHRHAWLPPFGYYDAAVHSRISFEGDEHEHV